jgi:acyl-CoA dehydrogenase
MSELVERARTVTCAVAARHAEAVDTAGRFPIESFSSLKEARLMGAFVPRELGGDGATVSEVASICHLLGRNCGSTGLIFAMHLIQTACIVLHEQGNPCLRDVLRQTATEQLLLASATTEAATGGDLGRSECAVLMDGRRFTVEKHGAVISYGDHADMILVTARRSPASAPSDQVLAVIPRPQFELTQTAGWDALGMRGTCSNTYSFRGEGHVDQILPVAYGDIQNDTMTPFAHLTWCSVWLGLATDALTRSRSYLRNKPNATAAQARFVDASMRLQQMRSDIVGGLRLYEALLELPDRTAPLSLLMTMNNLKISVSSGVVEVIQQAMKICGIAGYRNDSPHSVGRHLRDALSAALMVSNDRIAAGMGKMLLMQRVDADLLTLGDRD